MPTIRSELVIHSDCEFVFDFSQDYKGRLKWDPFLKEAYLLDGAEEVKVGVLACCVSKIGIGMVTKYITFQRPNVVAIQMTKGPRILKDFAGSWIFKKVDKHKTKVTFHYYFCSTLKLVNPFLFVYFRREMKRRLINLKNTIENIKTI